MEALASVDHEIADGKLTLGDLRTRAQEWSAPVSADGLLAFYSEVRDVIAGRLATSQSTIELHGALHGFLEGVWVKVELDGRGLHCEYVLRDSLAVMCGEVEKEIEVRSWLMEHRRKRDAMPSRLARYKPLHLVQREALPASALLFERWADALALSPRTARTGDAA